MSVLYMVRHGQASFGSENYDCLSERGIIQARILAQTFIDHNLHFDALYSGTIQRQAHTADTIRETYVQAGYDLPRALRLEAFNEYDSQAVMTWLVPEMILEDPSLSGDFEQVFTNRKAFQRIFERCMLRWISGTYDHDGFESWQAVKTRVAEGLKAIIAAHGPNKQILLVASGGTISAAVQHALNIPDEDTMRLCWQVVNTSVTRLMYNQDRITLQTFNSFEHLEKNGTRENITYR